MTVAVSMKGVNQLVEKINAHACKHVVAVTTQKGKGLVLLIAADFKVFERLSDGIFFLEGLDEGISLMRGEID